MEFGSLKYGLPRRSAPRNDVNYCNPELLVLTSLRAPEGGRGNPYYKYCPIFL